MRKKRQQPNWLRRLGTPTTTKTVAAAGVTTAALVACLDADVNSRDQEAAFWERVTVRGIVLTVIIGAISAVRTSGVRRAVSGSLAGVALTSGVFGALAAAGLKG